MLDFNEYLKQSAGIAAQKQQEVAAQASSKKASISGQPDMNKVSAAISNPELLDGLTEHERDLATLNAAQMFDKYGSQALAGNTGLLDAAKQRDTDIGATRTIPEVLGDTAIGVGQGVANFLGGTAAMATIPVDSALGTNVGGSISEGMDWLNEAANNLKSDALTGQNRIVETNKQLLENINDQQYEKDKAEGAGIEADLYRIGRGFMNTAGEILDNPAVLGDVTAQGIGSVIPTGATAKGLQVGINLFKSAAEKVALKEAKDAVKAGTATATQKALLQPSELATSGMIGISTAGGAYNQTYSSAMEELSSREDLSQEEKEDMANKAARTASLITLPTAIAAGKLVSKFEANPLAYGGAKAAALNVVKEPVEETLQEGKSKFAENVALAQEIDPNRSLSKGVGESGGEGAVGGLGTAGVLSGPGAAIGVAGKAVVGGTKAVASFIDKREAAAEAKAEDETANTIQTVKTDLEAIKERVASNEAMNASEKDLITPAIDEIAAIGKPATFTPTPTSTDAEATTTVPKTREEVTKELTSVTEEVNNVLNKPATVVEPTEQTTPTVNSEADEEAKADELLARTFELAGNNPALLIKQLGSYVAMAPKQGSKLASKATAELIVAVANQQSLLKRYENQEMPDNGETAYIKIVAEKFKDLQADPKFVENYEVAKKRLIEELNNDKDLDPVQAEAYAKAAIADPTLITSKNVDKLIRNMAPLVSSDPERAKTTIDSLKLLQGAVDVLSKTAGTTSVSDAQAKSESNVANKTEGVFKSLQNYVTDFVTQTEKKQDTTKTLTRLARFAQGELNKLAALDYSKEVSTTTRGLAPGIKPLTFSYTNEDFVETYGKGMYSLSDAMKDKPAAAASWKTSNELHSRIKLEADTALGLYNYFNNQLPEDSRLPSLVQKGGIWKPDGTQELEIKLGSDGKTFTQVVKEATPTAITPPAATPAVTTPPAAAAAATPSSTVTLTGKTGNTPKDQKKANISNKFIGAGVEGSSTAIYAKDYGDKANTGQYSKDDVVFISVNGNRPDRVEPNFNEIQLAINAGSTIVTDNPTNRNKSFNKVGEGAVADYLTKMGYSESEVTDNYSKWTPAVTPAAAATATATATATDVDDEVFTKEVDTTINTSNEVLKKWKENLPTDEASSKTALKEIRTAIDNINKYGSSSKDAKNKERLTAVREQLKELGIKIHSSSSSTTPPASVTPAVEDTEASLARIKIAEDQLNIYEKNIPTDEKDIETSLKQIREYTKEVNKIGKETKDEKVKNKATEVFNRLYSLGNKLGGNDVREGSRQLDKKLESFEPKTKVDMKSFYDSVKNFFNTPKDQNSKLAKPIVMLAKKIGYKQAALLALDIYSSTNRTKGKTATEDLNEFRDNSLLEALKTEDEEFASIYKHYKDKFKGRERDTKADSNPSTVVTDGDGELFREMVYYSQMFVAQPESADKELNEVNLETIKNAEYVFENGEEYLKFDSKKYFKSFIGVVEPLLVSRKDETQLQVLKMVLDLLPKNHSTRLGVTRNPYSNSEMNSVTLTSRAQTGNYFNSETIFHEYFHAATVGITDDAYDRDLKDIERLLKNYKKSDEYAKATTALSTDSEKVKNAKDRLKSDIDYALYNNDELGAVLASSVNVINALREYSVVEKDPSLKGMTNLTGILDKLYKAMRELLGKLFDGEVPQSEIDKSITIDRIFRGAFENYHNRRILVAPIATPVAPESTLDPVEEGEPVSEIAKEVIKTKLGEMISSLGSGVEGVMDVIKSWIKVSQGKTNILQTVFSEKIEDSLKELQTKLPAVEEGIPQINLVRDFQYVRDVIKYRARNFSTQKAYQTFKTRLETVKDQGVLKIYNQDFAAVWLNSNGELDDKLLDMLALSSIIWMHSGNAKGQFGRTFIASVLNEVATADKHNLKSSKGEGKPKKDSERVYTNPKMKEDPVTIYDKDNVPKNVYYGMQKFFPADQTTQALAQVFKQISGISVSNDAGSIATQGIVDVFGSIMLNGLNDAGLIERHLLNLNNKKVNSTKLNAEDSIVLEVGEVLGLTFQDGHDTNGKLSKVFEEHFKESLGGSQLYYTTEDTKPIPIPNTQIRSEVKLSQEQKKAVDIANNIVYVPNKQIGSIYTTLGLDGLDYLFGSGLGSDFDKLQKSGNVNEEHFKSLEGKRLSVSTDVEAIQEYLKGAEGKDENFGYKFAHAISKVFRLQQKGNLSTPQGSKIIRSLLSPNRTTLDFSNSKHEEVFRRALAQAWGIKVAEKENWNDLLNNEIDSPKFKKALEAVARLENGKQPSKSDLDVLKHYTEEGSVGLLALTDYVKYLEARNSKDTKVQIHLPIEADGKTNGPAAVIYMLVTKFNADWFTNMNRVGIDIGADKGKSLRELYNTKNGVLDDVYTNVAKIFERFIGKLDMSDDEYAESGLKIARLADGQTSEEIFSEAIKVKNFAAKVIMTWQGEKLFSIDKDTGSIVVGRGLVKNPITVTLYGAGEISIANKITGAILDVIYAYITETLSDPNGDIDKLVSDINGFVALASDASIRTREVAVSDYESKFYLFKEETFQYKYIDINKSTDEKIEALKKFKITDSSFVALSEGIKSGIVSKAIAPAIKEGVGTDALDSTKDMIIFSNILGMAAKTQFDRRVAKIVDERRKAYLASLTDEEKKTNKTFTNRPDEYFITKAEMDKIYKETYGVNPAIDLLFGSISLNSTEKSMGDTVASGFTSVKGKGFNAQSFGVGVKTSNVVSPGVKILPYTVISSGDASTIIGSFIQYAELMSQALAVFDGVNLTLDKAIETNEAINTANIEAWNENIYAKMNDVLTKAKDNVSSVIDSMVFEDLIKYDQLLISIIPKLYGPFFRNLKQGKTLEGKPITEEYKNDVTLTTREVLKNKTDDLETSFIDKAKLVEAKLKVIEKLGLSSDQFSAVEAPSFSKGTIEASDFSKLTPKEKEERFNEMLADEENGISSSTEVNEGKKVVDYLKDLVKNRLANIEDRRTAKALLALLPERSNLEIKRSKKHSKGKINSTRTVYVKDSSDPNSTKEILAHTMDAIIASKIHSWVLSSQKADKGLIGNFAKDLGFTRLERVLTNLDKLDTSMYSNPSSTVALDELVKDIKITLGVVENQEDLFDGTVTLEEAYNNAVERMNNHLNQGTKEGKDKADIEARRITEALSKLIRESVSNPNIRNILGTVTATNSSPKEVVKTFATAKKDVAALIDIDPKRVKETLRIIGQLIRGIITSIFGEQLGKKLFSVKEDIEFSTQLFSFIPSDERGSPETDPLKKKLWDKEGNAIVNDGSFKKKAKDSVNRPAPPTVGSNQGRPTAAVTAVQLMDTVVDTLPKLAELNATDLAKATVVAAEIAVGLPAALSKAGFNLTTDQSQDMVASTLMFATILDQNPTVVEQIRRIYDQFVAKVTDKDLSKSEIDYLRTAAFKDFKDLKGNSLALPIFASLVQVSPEFANAVDKVIEPSKEASFKFTGINEFFTHQQEKLSDSLLKSQGANVDGLAASDSLKLLYAHLENDSEKNSLLYELGTTHEKLISKVDDIGAVALQKLAQMLEGVNTSNKTIDKAANTVGTLLNRDKHAAIARMATSVANMKKMPDVFRSLVRDVFSHDNHIEALTTLNKRVKNVFQSIRQGTRERIPVELAKAFSRKLNQEEWKTLTDTVGKLDLGVFKSADVIKYVKSDSALASEIASIENSLGQEPHWANVRTKALQLANYMATGIPGVELRPNAIAVGELISNGTKYERSKEYTDKLDQLISLYSIERMNKKQKKDFLSLVQSEEDGVTNLIDFANGIRQQEKLNSNALTKYNERKGYIPQRLEEGSSIKVLPQSVGKDLIKRGYKEIAPYRGHGANNLYYYYAPVSGMNAFIQGVSQNIRLSANGVDSLTGFPRGTINGGIIKDNKTVQSLIQSFPTAQANKIEGFIPIYNADGKVIAFERTVDLSKIEDASFETNLAKLMGIQLGRQYEELGTKEINNELVKLTYKQWKDPIEQDKKSEYVNVLDNTQLTRTQQDAISLVPKELKDTAQELFGKNTWMVRRDAIDIAFGYRQPGLGDFITGVSNWSPETQKEVLRIMNTVLGAKGIAMALKGEEFYRNLIKDAKLLIVVKSVTVSALNLFYNTTQLMANGVRLADISNKVPKILNESILLSDSIKQEIVLRAELVKLYNNEDEFNKAVARISALVEARKKLSIYPLYERGEFGSIEDVGDASDLRSIAEGDFFGKIQEKVEQLPPLARDTVKNLYMTKDSAVFQFLQKSVEYGDFIAKALLFEKLSSELDKDDPGYKLKLEAAYNQVKTEFVDYDLVQGRNRAWADSMGFTWFWNYALRTTKSATRLMFNHPFRSIMHSLTPLDTPLKENIFAKLLDGSISNSMGLGMLWRSPGLHPIMNAM